MFLAAHPHRPHELIKYDRDNRLRAKRYEGHGWIEYDQQFRLRLARDPTTISFANIDCELWIFCMSSPTKPSNEGQPKRINYNNGQCTRSPCYYLHKCTICSLDHLSRSCWRTPTTLKGLISFIMLCRLFSEIRLIICSTNSGLYNQRPSTVST